MKHHYVPQFFLKRWTNAAGKVHIFAIRNGQLVSSARAPEYTGYEIGLYALIANTFGVGQDHIERRLFGPLDSNAALVLDKFEEHVQLTEDDHIAWTFFLSSLRMRQPDVLAFLRDQGTARFEAILAEQDQATLPEDWPTTQAWFNQHAPGAIEIATLTSWLPRMIAHDGVADTFGGLKWWIREFDPLGPRLLLSDLPLHWEGGFYSDDFMIQLPIGPHRAFFGARSRQTEAILDQIPPPDLINRINRTTLASSNGRIWSSEQDEARAFIAQNLDIIGSNAIDFASLLPVTAGE